MNMMQALAVLDACDEQKFARPISMKGTGFGYFSHNGALHFRPGAKNDTRIIPSIKEMLESWEIVDRLESYGT